LLQKKYLNKTIIKIMQSMSISENNPASTPQMEPKMEQPVAAASNKGRIAVLLLLGMVFLGAEWYILETMFDDSKPKSARIAAKQGVSSSGFFQCRPSLTGNQNGNDPNGNPTTATTSPVTPPPPAQKVLHNNAEYDVFVVPMHKNKVKLYWNDDQGFPLRNFQALKDFLENGNQQLVFAMNAGMYAPPPQNTPVGLYVEAGTTLIPLARRDTGYGNFYMQPNGVFALNDTAAIVCEKNAYESLNMRVTYATQSGPMLVINGQLHPAFKPASTSLYIRNGVGVTADKKIVFAISNVPVNFYDFATLFKEKFNCTNALYLDGAISKMYLPQANRLQLDGELGPMIAIPHPLQK
jgi:uncharacterized protein YigE (DUF2233 family)